MRKPKEKLIPGVNDLATLFPALAKEWDYEKNKNLKHGNSPSNYTPGSSERVYWKSITGGSWQAYIFNRARKDKPSGDPFLSGRIPIPGVNDLATLRPDIAAEWDYEKNDKGPESYTVCSNKKVWWKSVTGESWLTTVTSRTRKNKPCGDPFLSGRTLIPGVNDLATLRPDLAAEWDRERNLRGPEEYALHSNDKVWWKSITGGSWFARIDSRTRKKNPAGDPFLSGHKAIPGTSRYSIRQLRKHS